MKKFEEDNNQLLITAREDFNLTPEESDTLEDGSILIILVG